MPKKLATETVTKLEAARRQLNCAIELWFSEKDAVSIHTLAYASYDVIHSLSKKKGRKKPLLFDNPVIKDKFRMEWINAVRRAGNFFKHADRDHEATLNFNADVSELFIYNTILGIELMGLTITSAERAFVVWLLISRPEVTTEEGRKKFSELIPVNTIADMKTLTKGEFFDIWTHPLDPAEFARIRAEII